MSTKGIPRENHEFQTSQAFTDPRNITVGATRIIWARATGPHDEGWVLPSGIRTRNRLKAHAAAMALDALCNQVAEV